jgi:hypothetical protein
MLVTFLQVIVPNTNQITLTKQFTSGVTGRPVKANYVINSEAIQLGFPITGKSSRGVQNYQFWS